MLETRGRRTDLGRSVPGCDRSSLPRDRAHWPGLFLYLLCVGWAGLSWDPLKVLDSPTSGIPSLRPRVGEWCFSVSFLLVGSESVSCSVLSDSLRHRGDCSPPGSSIHEILLARHQGSLWVEMGVSQLNSSYLLSTYYMPGTVLDNGLLELTNRLWH